MALLLAPAFAQVAFGAATERIGSDSKSKSYKTVPQPGWAGGLIRLPRHESRVYSRWVNGNEAFYFNSEPNEITDLITMFSRIRLRDHIVEVKHGKPEIRSFKKSRFVYNVHLNVEGGISLSHRRSATAAARTFEPVLTVYVGDADSHASLESFEWPRNLIVRNIISDLSLSSPAEQPKRDVWYAAVNFTNGHPAADFEHGMSTTVTLWEKGETFGFDLGHVSHKGQFKSAFSETEIARLKNRDMWLTMTVGNNQRKPSPDHPQLTVESLAVKEDNAKPVAVSRPGL